MPHLNHLFHFARQKRDNVSTVKMLHQMSIRVVVVALGLVLIKAGHIKVGRSDVNFGGTPTLQSLLFSISLLFLFSDFPCFFFLSFPRIFRVP